MPYFIFSVEHQPIPRLQVLGERAAYPEAAREARSLRATLAPQQPRKIRIVFADNQLAAEDLLLTPREAMPDGDD